MAPAGHTPESRLRGPSTPPGKNAHRQVEPAADRLCSAAIAAGCTGERGDGIFEWEPGYGRGGGLREAHGTETPLRSGAQKRESSSPAGRADQIGDEARDERGFAGATQAGYRQPHRAITKKPCQARQVGVSEKCESVVKPAS